MTGAFEKFSSPAPFLDGRAIQQPVKRNNPLLDVENSTVFSGTHFHVWQDHGKDLTPAQRIMTSSFHWAKTLSSTYDFSELVTKQGTYQ